MMYNLDTGVPSDYPLGINGLGAPPEGGSTRVGLQPNLENWAQQFMAARPKEDGFLDVTDRYLPDGFKTREKLIADVPNFVLYLTAGYLGYKILRKVFKARRRAAKTRKMTPRFEAPKRPSKPFDLPM